MLEVRQSIERNVTASAGSNNVDIILPSTIPNVRTVHDLSVSVQNTTAARGRITCSLIDSNATMTLDIFIDDVQSSLEYFKIFRRGLVVSTAEKAVLRTTFSNCVASDALKVIVAYTIREMEFK